MGNRKVVETSQEAYRALNPDDLRQTYKDILFALGQLKEATSEEIAASLKVKDGKIWRRLSEMSAKGLIYRPGTKRPLKSGKNGFTWKLCNSDTTGVVTESFPKGTSSTDFAKQIIQNTLF